MRRSTILALLLLVIIAQPCLSGWEVTRVHPVDADWSQLESISGRYASGRIEYTNGPPRSPGTGCFVRREDEHMVGAGCP